MDMTTMIRIQAIRNGVHLPTFYLGSLKDESTIDEACTAASRTVCDILADGTDCTDTVHFTVDVGGAIADFTLAGRDGLKRRTINGVRP